MWEMGQKALLSGSLAGDAAVLLGTEPGRSMAATKEWAWFERHLPGRQETLASPFDGPQPGHSIPRGRYGQECRSAGFSRCSIPRLAKTGTVKRMFLFGY